MLGKGYSPYDLWEMIEYSDKCILNKTGLIIIRDEVGILNITDLGYSQLQK